MKKQISRISPHQTSKVVALLYVVFTIPFMLIGIAITIFSQAPITPGGQPSHFPSMFFIFAPVIYGVLGYIFAGLGCLIYNVIVKFVGGFEFTVIEKGES